MNELQQRLEVIQLCETLAIDERDLVERCLDLGYEELAAEDKGQIRRLLNRQSASHFGALQRYRERRAAQRGPIGQPTNLSARRAGRSRLSGRDRSQQPITSS